MTSPDCEFGEACGLRAPVRLVVDGIGAPEAAALTPGRPFAVIGRAPGADLMLDHPAVSRRHAYLQVVSGRIFCIDLESRTGVHWADEPRAMGWAGGAEPLRIGPFQVRARFGGAEAGQGSDSGRSVAAGEPPPPTSRSFATSGLAEAFLEFLDPSAGRATWQISRALALVGRSRLCRIQLTGPEVSGVHCGLVRTTAGIWVVDLLGRGGTRVNGRPVRSARLEDGDELQVGLDRFRLRHGIAPALPARRARSAGRPLVPEVGPAPADRRGMDDAALAPLLREFGLMQQQMADQFQQALLSMFRLFSGMHEDQMSLIREELARLHQLTEEQRILQAHLTAPPPDTSAGRPTLRVVAAEALPAPAPGDAEEPRDEALSPCPDPGLALGHVVRATAVDRPGPIGQRAAGEDLHGQIIQRLALIQEERQGRWQKLLGSMLGRASPE